MGCSNVTKFDSIVVLSLADVLYFKSVCIVIGR